MRLVGLSSFHLILGILGAFRVTLVLSSDPILLTRTRCKPLACNLYCKNGHVKDDSGCGTCVCSPVCSPIECTGNCDYGYKNDENGCPTCECKDRIDFNPTEIPLNVLSTPKACSDVGCKMFCLNGFQKDANGCYLCKCMPDTSAWPGLPTVPVRKAICVQVMCATRCDFGYKYDANGCNTCLCVEPDPETTFPAPVVTIFTPIKICRKNMMCKMFCPNGFKRDANGCEICECEEVVASTKPVPNLTVRCSNVMCMMFCEFGLKKDANGCDICKCNESPAISYTTMPVPNLTVGCSNVMCMMFCEFGFKKDANGCDICKCNESPVISYTTMPVPNLTVGCNNVMCMMFCEFGFKKDANGCDICKCNESPAISYTTMPAPMCDNSQCSMICSYGYLKDGNGCDKCLCYIPCDTVRCADDLECNVVIVSKSTNNLLKYQAKCLPKSVCSTEPCEMICPQGFAKDRQGCNLCICQDPCQDVKCSVGQHCEIVTIDGQTSGHVCQVDDDVTKEPEICSDIQCRKECPFGFEKNEDGCFLCACYLPCASVTCDPGKVCTTVVIPSETDNLLKYRPVCVNKLDCSSKNCDLICPFGFLKDDKGCDLCQCDDPCENKCSDNQVCRAGSCVNIPNPMSALCLSSYCLVKCARSTFYEPSMPNQYDCSQCKCDDLCLYEDCGSKKCKMTAETTCILDMCFNTTKPKCYDLCPAMDCNQECDYGHHTDSNNCQLCSCFDPCDGKQCGPNAFCSIIDIFTMSGDGTFQKSPKPQVTCNDYIMVHSVLKIMADFNIINPLETALFNLQFSRQIADMLKVKEFDVIIKSIYENILVDFDVRTENKYEEAMVKNNLESIKQRRNFHITYKGQTYDAYFTDSQATTSGQHTSPSHTTTTTSYWYLTPGWLTPGIFDWTPMFPTTTTDSYDGVFYSESKPNSSYLYLILLSILIPVGVVVLVIMASLLIFLCCIKKKVKNVEQPPVYTNPSLAFISDFNSGLYSSYVPNSGANPVYPPHVRDMAYVSEVKVHPDTIEA